MENDLGYIIHHEYWNQRYASEAAEACLYYGFNVLGMKRIEANMKVKHEHSKRVAEKLGFKIEKQFNNPRNRNLPTYVLSITR